MVLVSEGGFVLIWSTWEASSIGAAKELALSRVKKKAVDETCIVLSGTDRQCEFLFGFHVLKYV